MATNQLKEPITLYWQRGKEQKSVAEFLKERTADEPMLYWIEPLPVIHDMEKLGPQDGFSGLGLGTPPQDDSLIIDEARLFWRDRMLHVIADGTGRCRWFECCEEERSGWEKCHVQRNTYPVLLRRDLDRFGLKGSSFKQIDQVEATEYRKGPTLFAWRLIYTPTNK